MRTTTSGEGESEARLSAKGSPLVPVSYDNGDLHGIYGTDFDGELEGYVNFYRADRYRTVAYYYLR